MQSRPGEKETERTARCGQHEAFGNELPEQSPATCAERGADRELLVAALGTREQEVGEIRARDEEDESYRALKHPERRPRTSDDIVLERLVLHAMCRVVRHVRRTAGELPPPMQHRRQLGP